jgi:hypothetical protein
MADFTILDAPETPAPLFAFRALKGAIFGSPNDEDERNKENATQPKSAHALRPKTSEARAVFPSPSKRRKTNPCTSPAKSILRTPDIPTPRKPNTNVTFKDVTPSLSPVLRRQESVSTKHNPVQRTEIIHGTNVSTAAQAKSKSAKVAAPSVEEPASKDQTSQDTKVVENASLTFDIDAYRASTENEMKKLVRYGQKMRDYARKQDLENTKLRVALERLQRENEKLRLHENDRKSRGSGQKKESQSAKGARQSGVTDSTTISRSVEEPKPSTQLSKNQAEVKSIKSFAATRSSSSGMPQTKIQAQKPPSPLKRKASTQLMPEPPLPDTLKSPGRSNTESGKEFDGAKNAQSFRPAGARLPPDRLAAARERVRRKAVLRKGTDANPSSPVDWGAL